MAGLTEAKYRAAIDGVTSIARTVYEAVPRLEEWPTGRILAELRRQGRNIDGRTAQGCIASLVRSGLVREPRPCMFIQAYVKERPAPEAPVVLVKHIEEQTEVIEVKDKSLGRFAEIAGRLRLQAKAMEKMADEIDAAALDAASQSADSEKEVEKLRQLKSLLKELG